MLLQHLAPPSHMSGVVHFKFKSAISFDSVQFDGAFVSVGELKNLIAEKKGLGREATVELILSDPRTHAEYKDDAHLLPKSTSVLVRRAPVAKLRALQGSTEDAGPPSTAAPANEEPSTTQRLPQSQIPKVLIGFNLTCLDANHFKRSMDNDALQKKLFSHCWLENGTVSVSRELPNHFL